METITKKQTLPKGFLSTDKKPTLNAIEMFFVYLKHLPEGWDPKKLNMESVEQVRRHFGVNYGFSAMIQWGIAHECSHSKTSSKRHESMSKAYHLASSYLGVVNYTNITLN